MSGREVFLGQLEYIGEVQRDLDRLATRISELPSPWPGMADARNESARSVSSAFDHLVAYQRILINKVGPREEVLGEMTRAMEAARAVDKEAMEDVHHVAKKAIAPKKRVKR